MPETLSRVVSLIVDPSFMLVGTLVASALLHLARRRRAAAILVIAAISLTAIVSLKPVTNLLLRPLEERFPELSEDCEREECKKVGGIVVLGGGLNAEAASSRSGSGLSSASGRVTEAAILARRFPHAKILYAGGGETQPEAEQGKDLLVRLGVDPERILVESRSRNTAENARFSLAMVNLEPDSTWLLVTSAAHMPRAIAAFRGVGFEIEAYPVDFRAASSVTGFDLPGGLENTRFAVKEYVGLVTYRLMGRTKDLFPSPRHQSRNAER